MKLALAGLIILIIGDSHLASKDFLLASLHANLVAQGATVHSYGVCGANPHDWIARSTLTCGRGERHNLEEAAIDTSPRVRTWSLPELLARYHPDLLIVELGDNMAGYGVLPELPRDGIVRQVRELLGPIQARRVPCLWVGPPWGSEGGASNKTFARVRELSDELAVVVGPCRYVDSLKFSQPGQWPTFDGEHLTPDGYRVWGADITAAAVEWVRQWRHR
jgi:lysophospholipase L1-like esterase